MATLEVTIVWQTALSIIGLAILGAVTAQILLLMARSGRQAAREWTLAIRHERRAAEARVSAERLRAHVGRDAGACGMRDVIARDRDAPRHRD
ncbi:MAG: hypothetical protein IPF53_01775 [Blastocatellia bacterium]|jgi:predicted LPLAT superfamily acyltransferase|nr:hypothetical protein [Blastocatellia bacterium]MBK6425378.1 hypothetical protein [Blastocatellia bacterium]